MKYLFTTIALFIALAGFAQKKKLPSFKEVQRYNQTNIAISALAAKNATHRVTGDTVLTVAELNEILRTLDDKMSENEHKKVTYFIQSAINAKKHGNP